MRHTHLTVVLVVLSCIPAACEPDGPGSTAAQSEEWSLSTPPTTVIGELEGAEEYLFQRVSDGALLPDGRIVVADGGLAVIRVYGSTGELEAEMGARGEGPGEFEYLSAISVQPPDTILAYDPMALRLTTFLADGTLVETLTIVGEGGWPDLFVGRFDSGALALAWIEQGARTPDRVTPDFMEVGRYSADGRLRDRLLTPTGMRRFGPGPVPFSPFPHAQVFGSTLYFTNGLRPEILAVDGSAGQVRTIETPRSARDPHRARNALQLELEQRDRDDLLARLSEIPGQDSIPHVADMLIDDRGNIWGKRYDPLEDSMWLGGGARGWGGEWWVIDRNGTLLAVIELPDGVAPLNVRNDRLLGLSRDEMGVQRLVTYEIMR